MRTPFLEMFPYSLRFEQFSFISLSQPAEKDYLCRCDVSLLSACHLSKYFKFYFRINQMTQDIVATAPGQSNQSDTHLRHFSAIMEFSIKEIIKFCKKIPAFT